MAVNNNRTYIISILLVLLAGLLVQCSNDDDVIPGEISLVVKSPFDDIIESFRTIAGGHMHYGVEVDAPAGFKSITVNLLVDGSVESEAFSETSTEAQTSYTTPPLIVYFNDSHIGKELILSVVAVDSNDQSASAEIPITVVNTDLKVLTERVLKASQPDGSAITFFSTNFGFANSSIAIRDFIPDFAEDVDLGYYFGTTAKASIASPAAFKTINTENTTENEALQDLVEGWSKHNNTVFKNTSLTKEDFEALTSTEELNAAFNNGTSPTGLKTNLKVGDVLAFETDNTKSSGSKKGVLLIAAITDGDEDGSFHGPEDSIMIELLVEK